MALPGNGKIWIAAVAAAAIAMVVVAVAFICRPSGSAEPPAQLRISASYPHDAERFTEGLFFDGDGALYESSGLTGKSAIFKTSSFSSDPSETIKRDFDAGFFAEGICLSDGRIQSLTYLDGRRFVFDKDSLDVLEDHGDYPYEGWGLTNDGDVFYASDGSSRIHIFNAEFQQVGDIVVSKDGAPLEKINELEWINGYIWANIWKSDDIVVIDPRTSEVVLTLDCSALNPRIDNVEAVLNGIAYNPANGNVLITGKYWPEYFEFPLNGLEYNGTTIRLVR